MSSSRDIQSEGLALDFYKNYPKMANEAFSKELSFRKEMHSPSIINKYLDFNEQLFSKLAIYYSIRGSKKNPYIIFHYPWTVTTLKESFGWEERAINLFTIYMPVKYKNGRPFEKFRINYDCPISIHALAQLIYRLKIKKNIFEKNYRELLEQLKYAHITSVFFVILSGVIADQGFLSKPEVSSITIPIPTPNGMFIGVMKFFEFQTKPIISIRTFVSDEELDDDQKFVRDRLLEIFEKYHENIEYSFFIDKSYDHESKKRYLSFFYYYFFKIQDFIDDFAYVLSYRGLNADNTIFFRLKQLFTKLQNMMKDEYEINNQDSIEEIYSKIYQSED